MFYPFKGTQTLLQYLLNTFDIREWFRSKNCKCCWEISKGILVWVPLAGCPEHD